MKCTIEKDYEYVPEWNGNRDDEEPIVVECTSLTHPQRKAGIRRYYKGGDMQVDVDEKALVLAAVKRVRNLEINGMKVETGKQLLETEGLAGLVDDVANEIALRTMELPVKNS
jgi:hypothetical protein